MAEISPQITLLNEGWKFVLHSKKSGEIINPQGTRQTAYFGFDSQAAAEKFMKLLITHGWGDCQIRHSKRINTCQLEVKVWHCPDFLLKPETITKTVGYAKVGHFYETYLFTKNGQAQKYKNLTEEELQNAHQVCAQVGWKLLDCTNFAKWFFRQSRLGSAPRQ